jgi:hypothetical protein
MGRQFFGRARDNAVTAHDDAIEMSRSLQLRTKSVDGPVLDRRLTRRRSCDDGPDLDVDRAFRGLGMDSQ